MIRSRVGTVSLGLIVAAFLAVAWGALSGPPGEPFEALPVQLPEGPRDRGTRLTASAPRPAADPDPWAATAPEALVAGPRPAQKLAFMVQVRDRVSGAPVDRARVTVVGVDAITTGPTGRRAVLGELPAARRLGVWAAGYRAVVVDVPRDVGRELLVELERSTTLFVHFDPGDAGSDLLDMRLVVDSVPVRDLRAAAVTGRPGPTGVLSARGGLWEGELRLAPGALPSQPGALGNRRALQDVVPGVPLTLELGLAPSKGEQAPAWADRVLESHSVTLTEGGWELVTLGREAFPEVTLQVVDVDGVPVPRAEVSLERRGSELLRRLDVDRLRTDDDGRLVARLPAGVYELFVRDERGRAASLQGVTPVDGLILEAVLVDPPPVRVRVVRESDGLPAELPWLEVEGPGYARLPAEPAGAPGEWWLHGLAPGTWVLLLPLDGDHLRRPIDIAAGDVTVTVPDLGKLELYVDTLGLAPPAPGMVVQIQVTLSHRGTGLVLERFVVPEPEDGPSSRLTFQALRAGDWDVALSRIDWTEAPGGGGAHSAPTQLDHGVVRVEPGPAAELRLVAFPR